MDLKPCPHCGGKFFDELPNKYGLIEMNNQSLNEVGVFGSHTELMPLKASICTKCHFVAFKYDNIIE